uniref:CRAL-TRIO domain-containing protein n=1 Tax=Rhabditophanes sp. KR3021 TaxID=114890 RepID=A0AC35U9S6_9BILA
MTVGVVENISKEELVKIGELRNLVKSYLTPYYDTNFNLLRWIQGHSGSIEEVSRKLIIHLRNRKTTWNLDELATTKRDHPIHNHWMHGITGLANENTIVNIEQCGATDFNGMVETHSITDLLKARMHDLEDMLDRVMKLEAKTGKQASIFYIIDLAGLKYDKKLISLVTGPLKSLSEFMSDNYVEMIQHFALINAPSSMFALWSLIKQLLPEKTATKVLIMSTNWRKEILNYCNGDVLLSKWNNNESNSFKSTLNSPLPFPTDNYFINTGNRYSNVEKISAGKKIFITKELNENQLLHWEISINQFMTFAVFYTTNIDETNTDNMRLVYPYFESLPGPTVVPFNDSVCIKKRGYYKILISNQKAWWNTLTAEMQISVRTNNEFI